MLISLFIAFNKGVSSLYKRVCIYVNEPHFYPRITCGYKKKPKNINKFFTTNKHLSSLVIIINCFEWCMPHVIFQYKNY
jgi:hypothetical protein